MIDNQENLREHIEWEMEQIRVDQDGLINNMIEPSFIECSAEEGYVKFSFTVKPWAVNKAGTVHGGILATCSDCIDRYEVSETSSDRGFLYCHGV